jgi:hypothetical protein
MADGPFKVAENNLGNFKGSKIFNETDASECLKVLDFKRTNLFNSSYAVLRFFKQFRKRI